MKIPLKLYNTASRSLESFIPLPPYRVSIYLCGPTVYGPAHLGHARSTITLDLLLRYLSHLGYQVRYVRNITDVGHLTHESENSGDDKIALQAKKESISPMEVAHRYTVSYRADMQRLNIVPPDIEPLATGHIPEQIALIKKILAQGYAYVADGSVYFDMEKYTQKHQYGILSGRNLKELRSGTRLLQGTKEKRNVADFALWKNAAPDHMMVWESPWSLGYPGWHLECAAMSMKYFGTNFDIHVGGIDLALHHDCEVAQVRAATEQPLARFWLHHNLVTMGTQKMSKSSRNFITLKECFSGDHPTLSRAYHPMVIRFFLLYAHYRSPIEFSDQALQQAAKVYQKLINGLKETKELMKKIHITKEVNLHLEAQIKTAIGSCYEAMSYDLNTIQLIRSLFELLGYIQLPESDKQKISKKTWSKLTEAYILFLQDILGLIPPDKSTNLIEALFIQYEKAKKEQRYEQVDQIRKALQKEGISIQDYPNKSTWSYKII